MGINYLNAVSNNIDVYVSMVYFRYFDASIQWLVHNDKVVDKFNTFTFFCMFPNRNAVIKRKAFNKTFLQCSFNLPT